MSTRSQKIVMGNETVLAVNKGTTEAPNFVVIKCATDINYTSSTETLTANCYEGQTVLPSGNQAVASISINGIVHEYATADQAANVSARDIEGWHKTKARKEFSYRRPHEGDTIRTGFGYITEFSESGTANDFQTYSATISFEKSPEITQVTA